MWKQLTEFNSYSVSDSGEVRNDRTGQVLKPQLNSEGYYVVSLPTRRGFRAFRIHRLIALEFLPKPNDGQTEVAHNDGSRTNNCATNLRWATRAENQRDRICHGTHSRGERSSSAKFTNADVLRLRQFMRENPRVSNCELGRRYGVSHETIRAIRAKDTYRVTA